MSRALSLAHQLVHLLLSLLTAVVALALVGAVLTRAHVNGQLRAEIERVASQSAGLAIEVGEVRGAWWSGLTLHDVTVHEGPEATSGVFATVPLVRAEYNLASLLGLRPTPLRIDVYHPRVSLTMRHGGLLSLQPKPPPLDPTVKPVPPPPMDLRFHGGSVRYGDVAARKPFVVELGEAGGSGQLRGFDLTLDLQALAEADLIKARAHYDLEHFKGRVHLSARELAMPYWVNRFGYAPEYELTGGRADLEADIAWQDPLVVPDITLDGRVTFRDVSVKLRDVAKPVLGGQGVVTFDAKRAVVRAADATLAGMPVSVSGSVGALLTPVPALANMPDPTLALRVTAPEVLIDRLPDLFPELAPLALSGHARLSADVGGTLSDMRVLARVDVPAVQVLGEPGTDGRVEASFQRNTWQVPRWALSVAGGRLTGSAWVGAPSAPGADLPYRAAASFERLELAGLIARHAGSPVPVAMTGRLSGRYEVAGTGERAASRWSLTLGEGVVAGRVVEALHAKGSLSGQGWSVPELALRWGGVALHASASGDALGAFALRFALPQGELSQLLALAPEQPALPVTGRLKAHGTVSGRLNAPASWQGRGEARAEGVRFGDRRLDWASAKLALADNRLAIGEVLGGFAGGSLSGHGLVAPLVGEPQAPAVTRMRLLASDVRVEALGALPPALTGARGRLEGDLTLHASGPYVSVAGTARAREVNHPEWGSLEALAADFSLDPAELRLRSLEWRQGDSRVTAAGAVRLETASGAPGSVDLELATDDARIATLLGAVAWPQVVARLQPAAEREAVPGPARPLAALPGAATAGLGGLERWSAYRKQPLKRSPAAPPVLPFWEGAEGKLSLRAHLAGTLDRPALSLFAQARELRLFGRHLDVARARLHWSDGRLFVPELRAVEAGQVVLTGMGSLGEPTGEPLVLRATGLDLGWTERALRPYDMSLTGRLNAVVRVGGPWERLRVSAEGLMLDGRFAGVDLAPVPFDRVSAALSYTDGLLDIREASLRHNKQEARLAGKVALDAKRGGSEPLNLALRLEDDNLGIVNLFSQGRFRWLGGKGHLALQLSGTALAPKVAGELVLSEGRLLVPALETPVEHVAADVRINDDRIAVRKLAGMYGGGRIELLGDIFWERFRPERVNLTAIARPFQLALKDALYRGMLEANLHLSGPVEQPSLSGLVSLWDGNVQLPGAGAGANSQAPAELPPLRLNNLNVQLGPSLRVRNAVMDVAVATPRSAYLRLDGSLAAPQPQGQVLLEGGTITPLNNPFNIVDGRIDFRGDQVRAEDQLLFDILAVNGARPEAGLDRAALTVTARATVYDYLVNEPVEVTTRVSGTLKQMDMRFTSEPLRSEQEIFDILSKKQVLAGTFGGRLDGGQVIVQEVGGLLTSNIEGWVSPYTLMMRRALSLQTLRFELVTDYEKFGQATLPGFKPALTLETRPLFERLALGGRLVAGEFYDTTPTTRGDNSYMGVTFRLNRALGIEYRVDPYVDPTNARVLAQTLGLKAQLQF